MQWEYRIENELLFGDDTLGELNKLGLEGWEVVGCVVDPDNTYLVFVMKRLVR